jgi:hypothetical protein
MRDETNAAHDHVHKPIRQMFAENFRQVKLHFKFALQSSPVKRVSALTVRLNIM